MARPDDLTARIASLSPEKQALLRRRLQGTPSAPASPPPSLIPSRPDRTIAPLSFSQQRLWFLDQLAPGSSAYNESIALRCAGTLRPDLLTLAFDELVQRHEILRTTFVMRGEQAAQVVLPRMSVVVESHVLDADLADRSPVEIWPDALRRHLQQPFDLKTGPLFRVAVFKTPSAQSLLVVVMHHIITDGWSLRILVDELSRLYGALNHGQTVTLPPLPVQYADYAAWQRPRQHTPASRASLDHWVQQLRGAPPEHGLDLDRAVLPTGPSSGASECFEIAPAIAARLGELARSAECSPFVAYLSTFAALLHRHSPGGELVIGTPVANRVHREIEPLLGFFVNTLALRCDFSGRPNFQTLLARLRRVTLDALAHQETPFEHIVEALNPKRTPDRNPLFQVVFTFQDFSVASLAFGDVSATPVSLDAGAAKFDLTLNLENHDGRLTGRFEFNRERFAPAAIQRLAAEYPALLAALTDDATQPLDLVATFPTADSPGHLVEERSSLSVPFDESACAHHLFERHAREHPAAVALVCGTDAFTYAELDARAHRWAVALRARGIGPETRVAICLPRRPALVVAVLAVLKAGAAYVPLDPAYPAERLRFMLQDSGCTLVLASSTLSLSTDGLVSLDPETVFDTTPAPASTPPPVAAPDPANAAYLIYTSGSTGTPKAVVVAHRSVVNLALAQRLGFGLASDHRIALFASLGFDASVSEMWTCFDAGATLVLATDEDRASPAATHAFLARQQVAVVTLPPTVWALLPAELPDLRVAISAGERCPAEIVRRWSRPSCRFFNAYGPTEITVCATLGAIDAEEPAPSIGQPIANTAVHVLDPQGRPVPTGAFGEIYVAGAGLARGYWRRPALTAERFVPHPFAALPGARLYRTGDLARFRPDASLDYRGRVDQQVKLRGFRVEPGEIEAVLETHPAVKSSAVAVRPDRDTLALIAYVVPASTPFPMAAVRAHLRERVPDYMLPAAFVLLDDLPRNVHGKVDRAALPAPHLDRETLSAGYVAPGDPVEAVLVRIWSELLHVPRVGANDDFFELGGHSLLAAQITSRIASQFGVDLPLREFFEHPTVARLAALVRERRHSTAVGEAIAPAPRSPAPPLSFSQERLWFLHRFDPAAAGYNVPVALRLRGPLDVARLQQVFEVLVARHEALRTTFNDEDGQPKLQIAQAAGVQVSLDTLPSPVDADTAVRTWAARESARPFDLSVGPLLRVQLLRLAADDHALLLVLHHIITDAWSMAVLIDEMNALYDGLGRSAPSALLPSLPIQYADFAAWQRSWLTDARLAAQIDYWKTRLTGFRPAELPSDRPRPARLTDRGEHLDFNLGPGLTRSLKTFSQACGATPFMTTLAAFKLLLFRHTHHDDLAVGVPVANRPRAETEKLVGFFVNTLVLRTDLSGQPSFRELLARVRQGTLEAYANQDLPFERLVDELKLPRDPSRSPLVQIVFAFQNAPQPGEFAAGLSAEPVNIETGLSKFDLTLVLAETGDDLVGSFEFNRDLFERTTIERLLAQFRQLLQSVVAHPDTAIVDLDLLPPADRPRLLGDWAGRSPAYPRNASIPQLFECMVRAHPAATAVVADGRTWSYTALNEHANRLAHFLVANGSRPGGRVAVALPRGLEQVAAVLAILKAGAAYVPLDPESPPARARLILAESRCPLVLGEAAPDLGPLAAQLTWIDLSRIRAALAAGPVSDLAAPIDPSAAAYVIHTSGSTGTPKGVEVPHRAVVRLVQGTDFARFGADETCLLHSPLAFDASTFELWGTLLHGGRLCVLPPGPASLQTLAAHLRDHRVSTVWLTASLFHAMVDEQLDALAGVRQVLAGGDVLLPAHVERFRRGAPDSQLINGYGPTENTTFTCCHRVTATEPLHRGVPIGRPIAHTTVYILDRQLRPVPVGVVGELYTGGDGLATGYAHQPALTAARFLPDPFAATPGGRLYRTGDYARFLADGRVEFLGRTDHQVKIRGFRIELGEIETALAAHPAVKACAIVTGPDAAGGRQVLAYAVLREPAPVATLRAFLKSRLPDYMLPAAFVLLDALPVTSSGKLDRPRLPAPGAEATEDDAVHEAPRHATESALAAIWADLLGVPRVGIRDNFFELGGHSLLATRVVSRIATLLDTYVDLRDFFERPTIAELAPHLHTLKRRRLAPILPAARDVALPLSSSQERLWFLHRMDPESAGYNVPIALRLDGPLDVGVLSTVWDTLVARHESLRTAFPAENGRPRQAITTPAVGSLVVVPLADVAPADRAAELQRRGEAEARAGFHLATGPVFRARLLAFASTHHVLLLTIHHIVTDGWSLGVLVRELVALYDAFRAGRPDPLPPLALHYADYAAWQRHRAAGTDGLGAQLTYWKNQLAGLPALDLPTDRPRPPVQTHRGQHHEFTIAPALAGDLRKLGREQGATLFMTLLAAFDVVLWRWSRQRDVAVGTPIAGRNHPDTEDLFGYFVNTLVLRCQLEPRQPFVELLRHVRQTALEAYAHQDLPFDQLVDALNVVRDRSRSPLFQVMFVLQNTPMPRLALPGLAVEPMDFETQLSKFDLTVSLAERPDGSITGTLEYNRDLFDPVTAARLAESYGCTLAHAAAHPLQPIDRLEVVPPDDRHHLLVSLNRTAVPLEPVHCAHQLVERQAATRPDATAVVFGTRQLTYRELEHAANRLAHVLIDAGVRPETRVGLCMERGLEMIVAIVALLKAGGAYVPLDPAYPRSRLTHMLADSACPLLLVHGSHPADLASAHTRVVALADWHDALAAAPVTAPVVRLDPDNAAYVIYTSGSTGRPKGALIPHRGLINLQAAQRKIIGLTSASRILQFASLNFDASVSEMWSAFGAGATLVIAAEDQRRSPAALATLLRAERIENVTLPPTLLAVVPTDLPDLRVPITAGERCSPEIVKRWGPGRHLLNAYGPSEITVCSTMARLDPAHTGNPPIGRPIDNVTHYVLAADGALVPPGVAGELYIGGLGVSRGYLARPALTAGVFLPDPFSSQPGARLYRTGDLVRYLPDGQLEFLGRLDDQIKIRGMRVELGEIENLLATHPQVKHSAVLCLKDARGDDRLVAYVTGEPVPRTVLQAFLKTQLPDHMVPSAFVHLDALPLNPSGKVDRQALLAIAPESPREIEGYRAPRTPLEEALAADWREVLDLEKVSVRDNFLEIGGNSMKVVQLLERFERKYPGVFTVGDLFDHHTIEQQAARIAPAAPRNDATAVRKPRRLSL